MDYYGRRSLLQTVQRIHFDQNTQDQPHTIWSQTMKERIVIVLIATLLGLLLTTAGYFIYQAAVTYQQDAQKDSAPINLEDNTKVTPEATPEELTITKPKNEAVLDKRTIEVKGRTFAENTVVVSTNSEDIVGTPAKDGKFSVTVTIAAGVNKIVTRSISPDGTEYTDERVVTYSTEDF